jgi:superfamily II DNA or RNA helicase
MSFRPGDVVRLRDSDRLNCAIGYVERVGTYQTRVNFIRLPWTRPDLELPEMRDFPHEQLVLCRDPWAAAGAGNWSSPEEYRLRRRAVELWLSNTQGQLGNARTDLLPHQVCLVHEVVERKRRRLLIAEEVGMGKTIETGMIIHALMQQRELERCLVVCPAGQIGQWQEELEEKLRVRFEVYRHDIDGQRAFSFPMVIASIDTLKLDDPNRRLRGKSHREILLEAPPWDLVVFDEAHRLTARDYGSKTEKTLNYRLAEELCNRTRDFIFLTGTPHDGNDSKFRNLLKTLEPQVVFSRQEKGIFFGDLILKNRKSEARDAEGERLFKTVSVNKLWLPPLQDGEEQFHAKLVAYLREGYGIAGQDLLNPRNRALGFVMTTFQKLASSSVAAVRKALAKRLKLLKTGVMQRENSEPDEDSRFDGEMQEADSEAAQVEQLREAFTKAEMIMLQELVEFAVPHETKWRELRKLVKEISASGEKEKFLIFTEYRGTIAFLKENLEAHYGQGCVEIIMGGIGSDARKAAIQRFDKDPACRFLLSTEAGGEGINLQFCNIVVNYDSPWNPFRVVQRIGRVHRIGQKRNMQIFNFRLKNDLDQRLTECHELRVERAVERLAEVTGLNAADIQDQLLGLAQEFIDYEKLYRQSLKESDVKSSEAEIAQGIQQAERAFQLAYETIFKHSVSPFNPDRFKKLIQHNLTLEDLREWLDGYLKTQGRRLMHREDEDLYEFLVPENLKLQLPPDKRSAKGTFDRNRAIKNTALSLFAIGHPTIDLLLRAALAPDSNGDATLIRSFTDDETTVATVTVLIRQEEHSGVSAYRLHTIKCQADLSCSFVDNDGLAKAQASKNSDGIPELDKINNSVFRFLANEFPDIDFLGEKLFWISASLMDKDKLTQIKEN